MVSADSTRRTGSSVSTAASTRQLPIYSVERSQRVCSISFDAAWGEEKVRQFSN